MNRNLKRTWLAGCLAISAVALPTQAAIVNVSLSVVTEDGFNLRGSSGAALANGSLVRIGYFYNPSTGLALDNTAITALYNPSAEFSANRDSLSAKFLEIGTATVGFVGINGSSLGYFSTDNGEDGINRPYGTAPANFAKVDDDGNPLPGTFGRVWFDGTLPIESLGTSPYNSISNVKLTGALLSVIAYNATTESASTELLVARALAGSELPSADETASVALGVDTSALLIGTGLTGAYATIPEPSTLGLFGLGALLFVSRRKSNLGKNL